MAYTAKTRANLIAEVIRELNDYSRPDVLAANMTAGASTFTATDYTLYTKYCVFEIDQELILGPSANATTTTITPTKRGHMATTAAAHTSGALIRLAPKYTQDEIIRFINTCLESELWQMKINDASKTTAADTKIYDLPTGVTGNNLKAVYIRSSTTDASATTCDKVESWRIRWGQGASSVDQIEFRFQPPTPYYILFEYAGNFTNLAADTDSCDLPLNEAAQRLPVLYTCAKLLPFRENQRLRRDRNTFPEGSTPPTARGRMGEWYWEEFLRVRKMQGFGPKTNIPITVGW